MIIKNVKNDKNKSKKTNKNKLKLSDYTPSKKKVKKE
jgi:hypothetical protein